MTERKMAKNYINRVRISKHGALMKPEGPLRSVA